MLASAYISIYNLQFLNEYLANFVESYHTYQNFLTCDDSYTSGTPNHHMQKYMMTGALARLLSVQIPYCPPFAVSGLYVALLNLL